MSSAISYEYLKSIEGVANGLATLDATGALNVTQLPSIAIGPYKGVYATSTALIAAFPTGTTGEYAYVSGTSSYWYWDAAASTAQWMNQQITATAYTALSTAEKGAVPWIIVP